MRKFILIILALLSAFLFIFAKKNSDLNYLNSELSDTIWLNDFELAKERSKIEDKPILLYFTGSNWCGWCIKLKKEVFVKDDFNEFALNNLILVEIDFPKGISLDLDLEKQNNDLADKYGINAFPTVVLVDYHGSTIARTGYIEGGEVAYINHLKSLISN
mgnify:CR=1 FL=1